MLGGLRCCCCPPLTHPASAVLGEENRLRPWLQTHVEGALKPPLLCCLPRSPVQNPCSVHGVTPASTSGVWFTPSWMQNPWDLHHNVLLVGRPSAKSAQFTADEYLACHHRRSSAAGKVGSYRSRGRVPKRAICSPGHLCQHTP